MLSEDLLLSGELSFAFSIVGSSGCTSLHTQHHASICSIIVPDNVSPFEAPAYLANTVTEDTMTVEICKPIRDDLADCVLRSNCVLRQERTVQDCIKNPQDLPEQCRHLMTSFSECKRGLVSLVLVYLSAFIEFKLQWRHAFTSLLTRMSGMFPIAQLDMRKRFRGIGNIAKPASADPVSDVSL